MKLILKFAGSPLGGGSMSARVLEQGNLTIGRSSAADWVVPDPSRVVSKLHCRIEAVNDGFILTDTSTNGVFIDGATTPLGRGNSIELHDGDRFRVGDHTIAVQLLPDGENVASLPSFAPDRAAESDGSPFPIETNLPQTNFLDDDWKLPEAHSAAVIEPFSPVPGESAAGAIPENWFTPASAGAIAADAPVLPRTDGLHDAARILADTLGIAVPSEGEAEAFLVQLARQHRQLVEGLLHSLAESVALRREFDVADTAGAETMVDRLPVAAVLALLLKGSAGERTLATAMAALRRHQDALSLAFRDVLRTLPTDLAATLREVVKRGYAAAAHPPAAADGRGDGVPSLRQARR